MREATDTPGAAPLHGEDRPKTPFEGSFAPETEKALQATRSVLKAIAEAEQRERARRRSVQADFEAAAVAILCEAAVDLLERGAQGFRCPRSMSVLERKDRYRSKALNKQLPVALDRLAELGFVRQDKGYVDASSGKRWQTAVWPGPELEALCAEYALDCDDFRDERPGDEIVLRRESEEHDGRMVPVQYADTPAIKVMRREVQLLNEALRAAQIEINPEYVPLFADPTKRKLRRMFKLRPEQRVGDAFIEGGRLSGGFWLDPGFNGEARRNGILIDGQPLAELDFGQSGLRILYGMTGAGEKLPTGDLYDGISRRSGEGVRDAVKQFVSALMNIRADDWETLARLTRLAEIIIGRNLDEEHGSFATVRAAIRAVHMRHPEIAKHLPSEIGRRVQKIEADILVKALLWLGHKKIVGLPVHDAMLVRFDRAEEAAEIMRRAFEEGCGALAKVTIKLSDAAAQLSREKMSLQEAEDAAR